MSSSTQIHRTDQVTNRGSTLVAGGNVTMNAADDIGVKGSYIEAGDVLPIDVPVRSRVLSSFYNCFWFRDQHRIG
ncbi:MAG: hemagglutinin repeat-containing protein [Alphaproteobacteria bacterium]|nr:hemagglutinin repeat-containing protein [Alphaproteobacteria bacterium]